MKLELNYKLINLHKLLDYYLIVVDLVILLLT